MKKITHLIFLFVFGMIPLAEAKPLTTLGDSSLYELTAHLMDQDGKKVGLDVFKGQPVVVSMFYASCNYTCPMLIDSLKKMDAGLSPKIRAQTKILLISFDPEHDTAKVLKKLATDHHLDLSRWKLVAPPKEEVRDIAALLDYTYRPLPEGGFNHTSSITLLDGSGVPVLHEEGVVNAAESVAKQLEKNL